MAEQMGADWYAVHVETPNESVKKIATKNFVTLLDNINLAGDLGAETVWLKGNDIAKTILDYARDNGITRIMIGRTHQPWWKRLLWSDVPMRLIKSANDLDVEIVADEPIEGR